jgi:hypothetical protein
VVSEVGFLESQGRAYFLQLQRALPRGIGRHPCRLLYCEIGIASAIDS